MSELTEKRSSGAFMASELEQLEGHIKRIRQALKELDAERDRVRKIALRARVIDRARALVGEQP